MGRKRVLKTPEGKIQKLGTQRKKRLTKEEKALSRKIMSWKKRNVNARSYREKKTRRRGEVAAELDLKYLVLERRTKWCPNWR